MRRGQSYIYFKDSDKPDHVLVKALHAKGIYHFELIWATMYATDAGWCFNHIATDEVKRDADGYIVLLQETWLGFTKAEVLRNIARLEIKRPTFHDTQLKDYKYAKILR